LSPRQQLAAKRHSHQENAKAYMNAKEHAKYSEKMQPIEPIYSSNNAPFSPTSAQQEVNFSPPPSQQEPKQTHARSETGRV